MQATAKVYCSRQVLYCCYKFVHKMSTNQGLLFQGAIHAGIPVIIFGIFATSAGLLSLMLPETLNKKMPESVKEVERSAKKK